MYGAPIVIAIRVGVLVAIVIGQEASLVVEGVLQGARTQRHLRGEILQIPVVHDPLVAETMRPPSPVQSLPLGPEVPAQGNGFAPEHTDVNQPLACTRAYNHGDGLV
jgi:hypothetical protein